MMLIKLGGSAITDKSKPMTARHDVIDRLAKEISSVPGDRAIVHGGGSFGHIKAKQYGLHLGYTGEAQREGICQVQSDMRTLNRLVEGALRATGIPVASIPAGAIATFDNGKLAEFPSGIFSHYLGIGITPISFGDVVVDRSRGISICSGDDIMVKLAMDMGAEKAIFVTAVDGIFATYPQEQGQAPIPEIRPGDKVMFTAKDPDVTGSMGRKLELMFDIARSGCEVRIVNGLVPGRLADAMCGKYTVGTRVRGD